MTLRPETKVALLAMKPKFTATEKKLEKAEAVLALEALPTKAKRKEGFEALAGLYDILRDVRAVRDVFPWESDVDLPFDLHLVREAKHIAMIREAGLVVEADALADLVAARAEIKAKPLAVKEVVKKPETIHDFPISKEAVAMVVELGEYFRPEIEEAVIASERRLVDAIREKLMTEKRIGYALSARGGDRYVSYKDGRMFVVDADRIEAEIVARAKREADFAVKEWGVKLGHKLSKIIDGKDAEIAIDGHLGRNIVKLAFKDGTKFELESKIVIAANPVNAGYHRKYPTLFRDVFIKGEKLSAPSEKRVKEALGLEF